jgi:hypothetical protein
MRQVHTRLQRAVAAGALLTAAYAISGLSATAQDATSTTPSSTTTTTTKVKVPRTTATPEMISEAVRRSKARHEKFLATGKPEQWGSEEPFTK